MTSQPTCRTCRMRFNVPDPAPRETFNPIQIPVTQVRWLENAARVFDAESDQLFSAADFIAWIRPELNGRERIDVGIPPLGRPVEYDDPKHVADRERARKRRNAA